MNYHKDQEMVQETELVVVEVESELVVEVSILEVGVVVESELEVEGNIPVVEVSEPVLVVVGNVLAVVVGNVLVVVGSEQEGEENRLMAVVENGLVVAMLWEEMVLV